MPFSSALYGAAVRLCRNGSDASELVQETYLRAFRTFDNFQPGTNCKAWLFKIMYSVFVNKYRKEQREPAKTEFDEAFHRSASEWARDPDTTRRVVERAAAVERALDDLPDGARTAVLLVDVHGLTYEEAAATLECPVGTVRSRLSRGRKALFVALQEYRRSITPSANRGS